MLKLQNYTFFNGYKKTMFTQRKNLQLDNENKSAGKKSSEISNFIRFIEILAVVYI